MDFVGLTGGEALFGLAAAALAVTVLYLLKLRRRRVEVAFVELWREVLTDARNSELLSRLTRWGSWLLALLIAALLIFAHADPRPRAGERTLCVLLLDASLSMQATDVAPSRFERARARAHELVERLPEGDAALLVLVSAHPSAGQISSELGPLHAAIDAARVTETEADFAEALSLALDASHDENRVRFVLLTDGAISIDEPTRERLRSSRVALEAVALGAVAPGSGAPSRPSANFAVTALAARPHPLDASRAEVLLEVQSFADQDAELDVHLSTEGRSIEILRLEVPARQRVRRFFTDISGLDRTLEAEISVRSGPPDVLSADDHAYARIAERARANVAVVSRDNAYLEAALLLDEALEVTTVAPGTTPDPGAVDVTIFDGVLPVEPYGGAAIYIDPDPRRGGVSPLSVSGEVERPHFDVIEDDHPLMRWLSLRHVNVGRALVLGLDEADQVVAGDEGVPLLVTGERAVGTENVRFVALAFDVQSSDLPLRIAWPVLILDAIAFLRPHDDREPSFARAGERFHLALPEGAHHAALVLAGTERELPVAELDGRASLEVENAGVHRLVTDAGEALVAVSPAAGPESEVSPPVAADLGEGPLAAPVLSVARPARHLWEWLALSALLLGIVEVITYHRRVTV